MNEDIWCVTAWIEFEGSEDEVETYLQAPDAEEAERQFRSDLEVSGLTVNKVSARLAQELV